MNQTTFLWITTKSEGFAPLIVVWIQNKHVGCESIQRYVQVNKGRNVENTWITSLALWTSSLLCCSSELGLFSETSSCTENVWAKTSKLSLLYSVTNVCLLAQSRWHNIWHEMPSVRNLCVCSLRGVKVLNQLAGSAESPSTDGAEQMYRYPHIHRRGCNSGLHWCLISYFGNPFLFFLTTLRDLEVMNLPPAALLVDFNSPRSAFAWSPSEPCAWLL